MKQTRRVLFAANTQLKAQLAACNPESRQGLKKQLAAVREENVALRKQVDSLTQKLALADSPA